MSITEDQLFLLKDRLESIFVPDLLPLLDTTKTPEQQRIKNTARALSAFVLQKLCGIDKVTAAKAVVDDYDDWSRRHMLSPGFK